jgi:peptidoglycan/LPS O-acetylase OafA/YrhL
MLHPMWLYLLACLAGVVAALGIGWVLWHLVKDDRE